MSLASKSTRREEQRRAIERMAAHRLFHRMVSRQGVDLTGRWWQGQQDKILQALRKCELCANARACRGWLQSDGRRASYVALCPNAGLIETCRIIDPDAPPLSAEPSEASIGREPSLAEILAEPIIQLVMASDHIGAAQLQAQLSTNPTEPHHG